MSTDMHLGPVRFSGRGESSGGKHPDPPLDDYPLLAWSGGEVHTEDGRATVGEVDAAYAKTTNLHAIAERLGTTVEHVEQAARYAKVASVLGR